MLNFLLCLYMLQADQYCDSAKTFGVDYHNLPIYTENKHQTQNTDAKIPLPYEFPIPIRTYDDVDEPRFDPSVHLNLETPESVVLLPDFETVSHFEVPKVESTGASSLAFTTTFRVLSEEGVKAVHDIVLREKHLAHVNHRNTELRGLYYLSPFIRDLMTCTELLNHLGKFIGEPIVPHFLSMDAPSVNFGKINVTEEVVDHWHFDSVAYVAVILVSDLEDMVGGDLQVIKQEKFEAISTLNKTRGHIDEDRLVTVDYKESGFSILVQGSQILHHVTKVESAKEERLSLVMAFQPANVFQPDKTVLDTWKKFDIIDGTAPFEYARMKAWKLSHALQHYVRSEPFSKEGKDLTLRLKAIRDELSRTIGLLDGTIDDSIGWFDENLKMYTGV